MAEDRPIPVWFLIAAAVVIIVAAFTLLRRTRPPSSPLRPGLTEEQKAHRQQIVVTDERMSAAQNFLGDTVTYLNARVTNKGTKAVRQIEVRLEFVDTLNQVVLRETARPISLRTPPLGPGETRSFQVSFEHMPTDWNQAPPTITLTSVRF